MEYRPLGKTGLQVSVLSLGGAAVGQQYGHVDIQQVDACIARAIEAGVNLIDTSAYYGKGQSETILGEVLQGGRRDKVLICTKGGRIDQAEFDFTPAAMERSLEASLQRLRTDHVDIFLAHDIEFADNYEAVFFDTIETLSKLKSQGKCRFIGVSAYPLGLLRLAIEQCNLDVVITYCHFNLQNQLLLTELLPIAEASGVGILNASPLAMGLLTNQGPPPWHPASEPIKVTCRQAAEHCRKAGSDIAFLGMQYCYANGHIPSTITGTAKTEELEVNLRAMQAPIDDRLLKEVQTILEPICNLTWPSGRWKS